MEHIDTISALLYHSGKLEALLESSMNGIIEFKADGTILSFNPAARVIFNRVDLSEPNLSLSELLPCDESRKVEEKVLSGSEGVLFINCTLHAGVSEESGEERIKYLKLKFLSLPVGEEYSYYLIASDNTDVVRALDNREYFITTLHNLVEELKVDTRDIIYILARLVEIRDENTGKHLERVEAYTRILANAYKTKFSRLDLRLTDEYVEDMALPAVLHDVGKIGVTDTILRKPGKLDKEEFELIKEHTIIAGAALKKHRGKKDYLDMGREISLNHHEKWDGTGYPEGKAGTAIPLSGRIVSLCDVYDALTSVRPYKDAMPHEEAVEIINAERGKSFDPDVVDLFSTVDQEFIKVRQLYPE